jgi:5,5'-dehydrodivanillate O-demethylase
MGNLWRRYWLPIAASAQMEKEPTRAVRVLGENLVLYKDRSGTLGLVQEACAHRRVNLLYGIPEQKGIRCPYHGWLYDEQGRCLEQPAEATGSTFKDRIKLTAYPVKDFAGLIWAYLGPEPAPLLPRWDLFVWDDVLRDIGSAVLPCNWLQIMENGLDPVHVEYLHGLFSNYVLERLGRADLKRRMDLMTGAGKAPLRPWHHVKIGFDVFEHGIIKRRVTEGETEEGENWRVGHPAVFPNILRVGAGGMYGFQIRTPVDDHHTLHFWYSCYRLEEGQTMPKQEAIPHFEVPVPIEHAQAKAPWSLLDNNGGQDTMVWITQGPTADRSVERLGESDKGIILLRRLLKEQLAIVEDGGDPMNVFRDPAKNVCVNLPQEHRGRMPVNVLRQGQAAKYSPVLREMAAREAGAGKVLQDPVH